jgi:HEAT repeat protein
MSSEYAITDKDRLLQKLKLTNAGSEIDNWAAEFAKLGKIGVTWFLEFLSNSEEQVRANAALVLGYLHTEEALQPLITALDDPSEKVRSYAAISLGRLENPAAILPLITSLKDRDSSVADSAATALIRIGDEKTIKPLIELLQEPKDHTRYYAISTLRGLKAESAYDAIVNVLNNDASFWVKQEVVYTLGKLGNLNAVDVLIQSFPNQIDVVRFAIALALGWLGDRKALPFLQYVAQYDLGSIRDGDETVSESALSAIRQIEQQIEQRTEQIRAVD